MIFMRELAESLWEIPSSLRLFEADFHRMARIPRLQSEDLVIHSTGPFTPEEVDAISRLGRPGWLPDAC
jgi:hypothetical protein